MSDPHGQGQRQRAGAPALHSLREFQAVRLVEEVPGFAVGVVFVAFAAAFGVEGERGQAEDVRALTR